MFYNSDELKQIFNDDKRIFDNAYLMTKINHGEKNAAIAMNMYLFNYNTQGITKHGVAGNNPRKELKKMLYHGEEIEWFLMEYAMRSYILNEMTCPFTINEIMAYTNIDNKSLKYDRESIIPLVAVGAAHSPYWMVNLLACNKKVKRELVENLVSERYTEKKKNDLDNCKNIKIEKLKDGKEITISISGLNRCIDNMISDGGGTYYKDDPNEYDSKVNDQESSNIKHSK